MRVLLLNAGLGGNTEQLLLHLSEELSQRGATCNLFALTRENRAEALNLLAKAEALVIGTGTYWDSWSSLLQAFLEQATSTEGSPLWLGKPCAVIVTMHAVGGKGVLSRLQGVLNTFGCLIPPMSGLVYSRVNQSVLSQSTEAADEDLWRPQDLAVIAHNLVAAVNGTGKWQAWEVDSRHFEEKWIS